VILNKKRLLVLPANETQIGQTNINVPNKSWE